MINNMKQEVGRKVKAARLQRGLTQAGLAEAIDKAFETISNIERGKTAPNFSTLVDISRVLEVPMKDFFDFGEEDQSDERRDLLTKLNTMIVQMDDATLKQFLKLGDVLSEEQ